MPGKANEGVPRPAVPPLQAPVLPSHQCSLVDVAFEVLQLLTLWDGDHLLNLLQLRILGASGLHGCQDGFHPLRLLQQPPRGEGSDGQENGGFRPPPPWPNPPPCPRDSSSPALTCSPWSHIDAVQSGWPHSGKRKEKQGQGEPPPHTPWGGGTVGGRYPCSDSRTKTGGEMLGWPNSRPRSCVVVVENHTQWWWWRTMCGGGEPCVVVVVESHWAPPPGAGARLGVLDFPPCLEIFVRMEAMWGPDRDQGGATGFWGRADQAEPPAGLREHPRW